MHSDLGDPATFAKFVDLEERPPLRRAIDQCFRAPESEILPQLLAAAQMPATLQAQAKALARQWIADLRERPQRGLVQGLMHEYALSSQEGVALMCMAEALLRIPDHATRDALIADKIGGGDWRAHIGLSPSPFVNAASWGLMISGKLVSPVDDSGLGAALTRLIARSGAPLIRAGVDTAMRVLGEQFVFGQTIQAALAKAPKLESQGFAYSYDMLGEGAATAEDAARYGAAYEAALHAIGAASAGRGIYVGPGLSIKLSALHPRYQRSQRARAMAELLPRLMKLALLARRYDVGVNIDAEESERLDLSLDLLEALCRAPELQGWNGVGFVVQAYQKRAYPVLAHIISLARQTQRRIMLRLVKGAYWDSEIKRAQVDGLAGFAVFTRKIYTDVSYLACARRLLEAPDAIYPQFATHNAMTAGAITAMAGDYAPGRYEFQCLHGMGEPLFGQIVGPRGLNIPCRIYAPVGSHETLLAYLVRRLLENGANTSFVNRIGDAGVPIESLLEDPVEAALAINPIGAPHPKIAAPADLFAPARVNSTGIDLANESVLAELSGALRRDASKQWSAGEDVAEKSVLRNPADQRDIVGLFGHANAAAVEAAFKRAGAAALGWRERPPAQRAECLERAAALFESAAPELAGLIMREAGKTLLNAWGDIREAVDFLRYYAAQIRAGFANATHEPLGIVVCISPWNFPLAIFAGQVAAALAAGNVVLAKPAEETPLTAAQAVRLLHQAGVPLAALQMIAGDGATGALLTAHASVDGVMFTGSNEVARLIQASLAKRLSPRGAPVPLIAETGGQNALIVDSSALTEQVVADVLASAFDSAGQRCSALRVLCLQDVIAASTLSRIKSAMAELRTGRPDVLACDIGPVISRPAMERIASYIDHARARGFKVHQSPLGDEAAHGFFIPPTLIEIAAVADLKGEVFGPVLHVLRFQRERLPALIDELNATGFGLTGGAHSRIDSTIDLICDRLGAGNIYINRNIIGAVVGAQPFGGHGLSGTGPKAGGPLYIKRLLARSPQDWPALPAGQADKAALALVKWLRAAGRVELAARCGVVAQNSLLGASLDLPGPAGEHNLYRLTPRGRILCDAASEETLILALSCALSAGNRASLAGPAAQALIGALDVGLRDRVVLDDGNSPIDAALTDRSGPPLLDLIADIAKRPGPIAGIFTLAPGELRRGAIWPLDALLSEQSVSVNTTAAGGNANLMTIG